MAEKKLLEDWMTRDELAVEVNRSKRTVDRWERQGIIPRFVKLGNAKVQRRSVLLDCLDGKNRRHLVR